MSREFWYIPAHKKLIPLSIVLEKHVKCSCGQEILGDS
jgi:hypothetical protein